MSKLVVNGQKLAKNFQEDLKIKLKIGFILTYKKITILNFSL